MLIIALHWLALGPGWVQQDASLEGMLKAGDLLNRFRLRGRLLDALNELTCWAWLGGFRGCDRRLLANT